MDRRTRGNGPSDRRLYHRHILVDIEPTSAEILIGHIIPMIKSPLRADSTR